MTTLSLIAGFVLIIGVLWEAFETVVLPRRVTRRVRLTRLFYRSTWLPWSRLAQYIAHAKRREAFLSFYGPLSLILLLAVWAVGLVIGFALLHLGIGSSINQTLGESRLWADLYFSGTTFFTLGLGDLVPRSATARALTVLEAGMGFGFLGVVIGYLPVIYQSFSRREVIISMLDARAGSPPTAAELLRRHVQDHGFDALNQMLRDWEHWSAELLESHLSYPVLAYFRSQHNNQSWLAALTTILDASALVMAGIRGVSPSQARLTFAMARHAVADLAPIFRTMPGPSATDRLPTEHYHRVKTALAAIGVELDGQAAEERLTRLRAMYEPYVLSLSQSLIMSLPEWIPAADAKDNWQTSAWDVAASVSTLGVGKQRRREEHF